MAKRSARSHFKQPSTCLQPISGMIVKRQSWLLKDGEGFGRTGDMYHYYKALHEDNPESEVILKRVGPD